MQVVTQFENGLIQTTKAPGYKGFTKITLCYSVTLWFKHKLNHYPTAKKV